MRDYKGLKFKKLVLISDMGPGGGTVGRKWLAQCDCGNTLEVVGKNVAAGRLGSCGKCPGSLGIPEKPRGGYRARTAEEAKLRRLIIRTSKEAVRRNEKFALTGSDIQTLDLTKCHCCGRDLQIHTMSLASVVPGQGYTVLNVRPICPRCRRYMVDGNLRELIGFVNDLWLNHL